MTEASPWPNQGTMIPDLLRQAPQARAVLDKYGLHGCGGALGPAERLGFFARAHGVPLDRLLAEIRARLAQAPTATLDEEASSASSPTEGQRRSELGDTIYRPFFKSGIAVVLSLGAVWGAWLLVQIGLGGKFTAVGIHQVNAHGHAQIFGWVGLFVMGFAYQAFPRFKHTTLAFPRLAYATLWLMLIGLLSRALVQAMAANQAWAWPAAMGATLLEILAIGTFITVIAATWRRSGKALEVYERYILAALAWFLIQAIYGTVYLGATLSAANRGALLELVSIWQAPLRDMQIHGFALLMILGVSQRMFPHFYGLPTPRARLSRNLLLAINVAVVGEAVGLVLLRTRGPAWAGLWYAAVLLLTVSVALLVHSWHIFSTAEDRDRSLKFLRTAYVWLFVSLGMLVLLPAYQFGVLAHFAPDGEAARLGFSHAYYGAVRHAITVGFVSLMIVGVAAKVVPTLGGVDLRRLSRLWGPFVLLNAGCTLRVVTQTATDFTPQAFAVVGLSGWLEVAGLALWGGHLWLIMAGRPRYAKAEPSGGEIPGPRSNGHLRAEDTVGEILDQTPELIEVFLRFGFTPLANPLLRRALAGRVTLRTACRRTGVDLDQLLAALNRRRDQLKPSSNPETTPCVPLQVPRFRTLDDLPGIRALDRQDGG